MRYLVGFSLNPTDTDPCDPANMRIRYEVSETVSALSLLIFSIATLWQL